MTQIISERIRALKPSATIAVSQLASQLKSEGHHVINLSIGEPDFDTPESIKRACIDALNDNHTHYPPVEGIQPLRQSIAELVQETTGLSYAANQVIVSTGAKQSLYNLCQVLLNPSDEAIIPAPYWVSYPAMVELAGGISVIAETDASSHYKLTPKILESLINEKTKVLFFNSPSNPTGMVYTHKELKALTQVLLQHPQITIITDDIYEKIVWDGVQVCHLLEAEPKLIDRCVIVSGVSKAYAMTGWRIGFTTGPEDIIKACKKIQGQMTSGANSLAQYASLEAITGDQGSVEHMRKAFQERYHYFHPAINAIDGWNCVETQGAFYLFPNISEAIFKKGLHDDVEFAEALLAAEHVATVPGTAFGCPNHLRLSFATDLSSLETAIERIQAFMAS